MLVSSQKVECQKLMNKVIPFQHCSIFGNASGILVSELMFWALLIYI